MTLTRWLIVVGFVLLTARPVTAHAGTFDVYSCTLPNGSVAPTEGWEGPLTYGPQISVTDSCLSPPTDSPTGALRGEIAQSSDVGSVAGWVFTAPKFTTIANFTL